MILPLIAMMLQSVTPYAAPQPEMPVFQRRKEREAERAKPVKAVPITASQARFNACLDTALEDPAKGIAGANNWRIEGGGYFARHCLGFSYAEQQNWDAATTAFVEAAREAETEGYNRIADFWAQAGNSALAGGNAAKALEYLNAALVQGTLTGLGKGEVHLDRARAYVSINDYSSAKTEFTLVHDLAPKDPLGWLLSATLARRTGDLAQAKADITEASKLAGDDPAVALEAGNIAYEAGDMDNALIFWTQAAKTTSGNEESDAAKVAKSYLRQLDMAAMKSASE